MRLAAWILVLSLPVAAPAPLAAQWKPVEGRLAAAPAPDLFPDLPRQRCDAPGRGTTAALQVGAGVGGGLAGILLGTVAVLGIATVRYIGTEGGGSTDLDRLVTYVAYPSYALGSAAGVYWTGDARGLEGRFVPTLLGSAVGFGAPGATLAYHLSDPSRRGPGTGCPAEAVAP